MCFAWHLFCGMARGSSLQIEADEASEEQRSRRADLYLRHSPAALRLAFLLTGDRALADDLVQDAFVRLFGRLLHLRNPDAFEPYLRQTVVNLSRMHYRRQRVERTYLRREQTGFREEATGPDLDVREDLWQALLLLPERQRVAIVLHFYEDLSEQQAAEVLRCRPGTYRSLVSRGIAQLRLTLQGEQHA
jgi:RNA polymerase sigma-70 factor (sigma-E family)